jgi:tetratricopeptide (TPR) repeat protein
MKKQILTIALGLCTIASFSQKNELKAAERAIKKQDYASAVSAINSAESLIANADAKLKSKFYFLKGQAFGAKKDYETAAKAYGDLLAFEKETGRVRYSDKAKPLLTTLKNEVTDRAFKFHKENNFKESSKAFYLRYLLDKKDTLFLSNAAQLALQAKDFDAAFKHYMALNDLGYTGISEVYEGIDKATEKKVTFSSKQEMTLMMKSGNFTNPQTRKLPSKRSEILKKLVSVFTLQKKFDEALALIKKIRKDSPDDLELLLAEAFLYNDLKQPKEFEALMKEATAKDPTNPDLFFNIGIVNYNEKNAEQAIKYFTNALEIKSDYPKGNWMLANSLLLKDEELVVKMNALPPSDMKNYEKFEKQRNVLFNSILPILVKADKAGRTVDTVKLLIGVYEQLEMSDKADELRKVLKTL